MHEEEVQIHRKELQGRKAVIYAIIAIAVIVICDVFFFRNIIFTDFMLGNLGDGLFCNLITEHWWQVIIGNEGFAELPFYYPAQNVLGYSDMMLGFGLIHSVFRLAGINVYYAFEITLFVMHLLGSLTMYYLLHKELGTGRVWSMLGTIAFSYSCALSAQSYHPQLMAIGMMPLLFVLFLRFWRFRENRIKRNVYAFLTIGWFALLTYTAWYWACLTGLFVCVYLAVLLFGKIGSFKSFITQALDEVKKIGIDIIAYIVWFVVLYIPFLRIYLPVLGEMGGYKEVFYPQPHVLFNVTVKNVMLGWLVEKIGWEQVDLDDNAGFSVVLLALFLVIFIVSIVKKDKIGKSESFFLCCIYISIFICMILPMGFGEERKSLWNLIKVVLPPLSTIRAMGRVYLWLTFPMAVICAVWGEKLLKGMPAWSVALLALLLFFSQIMRGGLYKENFVPEERIAYDATIPDAPEDMKCFYIVEPQPHDWDYYIYQMEAYEIAANKHYKTINGHSGQAPDVWALWSPEWPDYEEMVKSWIEFNGLDHVYAYDRTNRIWIPWEERNAELNEVR